MINNETNQVEKVIILGAGPSGLSAGLYAARAELNPLILTGTQIGGQAAITNHIENYPGFPDGVGGAELIDLFQKTAEKFGSRLEYETATEVNLSVNPFEVKTYGKSYKTRSLIIATGASPNKLNIPGEEKFVGKGVSYCATCDGWFFKDKNVVVVGGGDSALEEGIFLTRFASSVKIIHRRDKLRAGTLLQKRVFSNPKIEVVWDTIVKEIKGGEGVDSVLVENVKTGERSEISTEGVFIFIGHKPNTEMFRSQLELDKRGYIIVNKQLGTSIQGVYAAGEACDPRYRQVITSAGMGAAAAIEITKLLESES